MFELDIIADTELRTRAIEAAEKLFRKAGSSAIRPKVNGLLQVAVNEPREVASFANKQKERAQSKRDEDEAEFWESVRILCQGGRNAEWFLKKARDEAVPNQLALKPNTPGAKPTKEQEAQKNLKKDREDWEKQWDRDHYPIFFRYFCSHLLYRVSAH